MFIYFNKGKDDSFQTAMSHYELHRADKFEYNDNETVMAHYEIIITSHKPGYSEHKTTMTTFEINSAYNNSVNERANVQYRLNSAFDDSGYSEYARTFKYTIDPVGIIVSDKNMNMVGSFAEGTQLSDSDIDSLSIDRTGVKVGYNPQAVEPDSDIPYLYLKRGPSIPPGYARLQIYMNGKPCRDKDIKHLEKWFHHKINVNCEQKCFLTNILKSNFNPEDTSTHGPALTIKMSSNLTLDSVFAYESKNIPTDMESWFERTRLKSWPSKSECDLFKSMGCLYVGVGHANSPDKDVEWRISPTRQELYLMLHLNPTQFRCYILLKMIKKYFIQTQCGDIISSYHCKTVLFYLIEDNESSIWHQRNLMNCVLICLIKLLNMVTEKTCPNYFVPRENMFEAKLINNNQIRKLQNVLVKIIRNDFNSIHNYLLLKVRKGLTEIGAIGAITFHLNRQLYSTIHNQLSIAEQMLIITQCIMLINNDFHNSIRIFQQLVSPYKINIDILLEMFKENIKVLNRKLHLKDAIAKIMVREYDVHSFLKDIDNLQDKSLKSLIDNEHCLKLASIAFSNGEYIRCDILLRSVYMMNVKVSLCNCYTRLRDDKMYKRFLGKELIVNMVETIDSTSKYIINHILLFTKKIFTTFTNCLQFDECEYDAGVAMTPVHFEAYKTVGIQSELLVLRITSYIISVHPLAYLYFLQYKNSEMVDKTFDMRVALEKLEHMNLVSMQEDIFTHPDTTLNLIGNIYISKGWYRLAIQCFKMSLQMQPRYNSVKWHVMVLLFGNASPCRIE